MSSVLLTHTIGEVPRSRGELAASPDNPAGRRTHPCGSAWRTLPRRCLWETSVCTWWPAVPRASPSIVPPRPASVPPMHTYRQTDRQTQTKEPGRRPMSVGTPAVSLPHCCTSTPCAQGLQLHAHVCLLSREQTLLATQRRTVPLASVVSRSISPRWRSIRFRMALRTYAPWGCIVRVVSLTKSRNIPTRKILPLFFAIRWHAQKGKRAKGQKGKRAKRQKGDPRRCRAIAVQLGSSGNHLGSEVKPLLGVCLHVEKAGRCVRRVARFADGRVPCVVGLPTRRCA